MAGLVSVREKVGIHLGFWGHESIRCYFWHHPNLVQRATSQDQLLILDTLDHGYLVCRLHARLQEDYDGWFGASHSGSREWQVSRGCKEYQMSFISTQINMDIHFKFNRTTQQSIHYIVNFVRMIYKLRPKYDVYTLSQ